MTDTVRSQTELLAMLVAGNPEINGATTMLAQSARDLIVSIFPFFPSGPDSNGAPITTNGIPGLTGPHSDQARRFTVLDGSVSHPVTDNFPTAYISREFYPDGVTTYNNPTALQVVAETRGSAGAGAFAQIQAIYGWAANNGSDNDAAAVQGTAFIMKGADHSNRQATAFGMFAEGVSYDPYMFACGINPFVAVASTQPYATVGKFSAGVFTQSFPSDPSHYRSYTIAITPGTPITLSWSFAVTITQASPAVATATGNDFVAGTPIQFTTTGTLPAPLQVGVTYYVLGPNAGQFRIAATPGGTNITTTSAGSGTHTVYGATGLSEGDSFVLATTGTLPGALTPGTVYFASAVSTFQFNIAATLGGSQINNATGGSGTHTLTPYAEQGVAHLAYASFPSNAPWSHGFATHTGAASRAGFQSNDSATTGFQDLGTHVNAFDASGATVSGLMFKVATNAGLTAGSGLVDLSFETGYGIIHDTSAHKTEFFGNGNVLGYIKGNWTPAGNETAWHLYEGATPTDRQVKWKDGGSIGAGDKVMVLV